MQWLMLLYDAGASSAGTGGAVAAASGSAPSAALVAPASEPMQTNSDGERAAVEDVGRQLDPIG